MGMEVNGVTAAASYQSQNTQAAKPITPATSTTTTNESNIVVAESSKSATSNVAVSIGQAGESEQSGKERSSYNEEALAGAREQKAASSMGEVKDFNKLLNNNTIAEFSYNEPTKRIAIKIKDKETQEVIKEIPSEKALEMLAKAWELAGIMVDERR